MNKTVSTEKLINMLNGLISGSDSLPYNAAWNDAIRHVIMELKTGDYNLSPPDPDLKAVCDSMQNRINDHRRFVIRADADQFFSDLQALVNHARNTDNSELVEALKIKCAELEDMIKRQAR